MRRISPLVVFFVAVVVAVAAILALIATQSWWVLGLAFVVLVATLALIGADLAALLRK
jgi:putative effector of murein hydrolase LrgA (UPF0299 family)